MIPTKNQIIDATLVYCNLCYAVGLLIMKKAQEANVSLHKLKSLDKE